MNPLSLFKCMAILFISIGAAAQVVRSPESDLNNFNQYIQQTQKLSFIDYYERSRQQFSVAYEVADPEQFAHLLGQIPMSDLTRELWLVLLLKHSPKSTKIGSLLQLDPSLNSVLPQGARRSKNLTNIKGMISQWLKQFPADTILYIDGMVLAKAQGIANLEHQFVVVSNTHAPFIYYGKWADFLQAFSQRQAFVSGPCSHPQELENQPWEQAYYYDTCIYSKTLQRHLPIQTTQTQISEQKSNSWLWPAVVAAGVIVAVGLKDKQVKLKLPSFNF